MSAGLGAVRSGQLFRFGVCMFTVQSDEKLSSIFISTLMRQDSGIMPYSKGNLSWLNGHRKRDRLY